MLYLYLYFKDDNKLFPKLTAPIYISTCLVDHMVKNLPAVHETKFNPWVRGIPWRREWQPTPVFLPGKFHGQK